MKTTLKMICLCIVSLYAASTPAEEEAVATFKAMKPALALELAQATLKACRVILRDQLAGAHTPDTARRKAWTAASFRTDTKTMTEETQAGKVQSGARFISGAMMIGGGIPVTAAGTMVGAVGVSGAPGGDDDHTCAQAGIDAIEEQLMF
jgi:uncharacterized protein GlcG (DUF336 family)